MKKPKGSISRDDRVDLFAYFSGRAFARLAASSMGPALERAERIGGSRPCPVCQGVGRLDGSPSMRRRAESSAERRRRERAWVVAAMKPERAARQKIPHLAEYRRMRDDAATAEDRFSAYADAERYRRAHAAAIASELEAESAAIGSGEVDALWSEVASIRTAERLSAASDWCPACGGARMVGCRSDQSIEVVTDPMVVERYPEAVAVSDGCYWVRAAPTDSEQLMHVHETRSAMGVDIGESEIERLGRVGARLSRVAARGAELGMDLLGAIARMHHPAGGGGPAVLLSMTTEGRALIRQYAGGWSDAPTPEQVLDRVRERQRTSPDVRTGSRLQDARRQAEALYEATVEAWSRAATPRTTIAAPRAPRRPRLRAPVNRDRLRIAELVRGLMGGNE
ncbi:MAG: hypothetical protein WC372_10055 [Candidatus Neomarinimicrobiota bacterium]